MSDVDYNYDEMIIHKSRIVVAGFDTLSNGHLVHGLGQCLVVMMLMAGVITSGLPLLVPKPDLHALSFSL